MAFVPAPGSAVGAKSFCGTAVSPLSAPRVAAVRMAADSETADSPFAKTGKSMWKENFFTGGFPGGEEFYLAWTEEGMTKEVPDMPASMQSSVAFQPKEESKGGILGQLEKVEFFKGFIKKKEEEEEEQPAEPVSEEKEPDESLYAPYFPAATRYLAPDIKIEYEKNFRKDRVGMAMTEVTASVDDLFFPKETKNKAPIIEVSYYGSLAGAYVSVRLGDIEGLPTLPPPAKPGEAVTTLTPGSGGGLKLNYAVEGEGPVNI